MTANDRSTCGPDSSMGASTSPLPLFQPGDLAPELRVRQSDFARICGVSRQTVSVWVRKGKIRSIYPDGTFNPHQAAREVINSTDPARLRAKIFRIASEDAATLRRRVADLGREATSRDAQYRELAAVFDTFRRLLMEGKARICADAGARFDFEIAMIEDVAWFEVLNPDATDELPEDDWDDLPLFDQDDQAPESE